MGSQTRPGPNPSGGDPTDGDGVRVVPGAVARGREVELVVDGQPVRAYEGESVAAALLAAGRRALRTTGRRGEPRGLYCGIGACFDCVMAVDGRPGVRACQTPVRDGMRVETQHGAGAWRAET